MVLAHELNRTPMPTSNSDLTSFSFLVLIFLSPCDVAIPAILPCHNSAQISIYGVSYPHKRKHFLTGPHWPMSRRFNGSGNLIDRSDKTATGANVGPKCSGGPIPRQTSARCGGAKMIVLLNCGDWLEVPEGTSRPGDILKQIKPRLTPHYFRHNYVTLLYESGVDPLIAMKIVGHTDYQTTANIYTHVRDEMLKKATVNMNEVFQSRIEK